MAKKPVDTVAKVLSEDDKKAIAEKLLDPSVDEVIIIYHKDKSIHWQTSCGSWPLIFGTMEMARTIMEDEWQKGDDLDEEVA